MNCIFANGNQQQGCDYGSCLNGCLDINRTAEEDALLKEVIGCEFKCHDVEYDLCELHTPSSCDMDSKCSRSEHCAVIDHSVCQNEMTESGCLGQNANSGVYECQWDSTQNSCYVYNHPCYNNQDSNTCEGNSACEWHIHCYNASRDNGGGDNYAYCIGEVCKWELDACRNMTECNDAWVCIEDAAKVGNCNNGVCVDGCAADYITTTSGHDALYAAASCVGQCTDGNGNGNDEYCEKEVCASYIDACSLYSGCNETLNCIFEQAQFGGCDDGSCYFSCYSMFARSEMEEKLLLSVAKCEFGCHNISLYFNPDMYCYEQVGFKSCDSVDGCASLEVCKPKNDGNLCGKFETERDCIAPFNANYKCLWHDEGCNLEYHPCFEAQTSSDCEHASFGCEWDQICVNATHHMIGGGNDDTDGFSPCEKQCEDTLLKCLSDKNCSTGILCLREQFSVDYCDQDCYDLCFDGQSTEASLLMNTVANCISICENDRTCTERKVQVCSGSNTTSSSNFNPNFDPVCTIQQDCGPTFKGAEKCFSLRRRDLCDNEAPNCRWNFETTTCEVDYENHICSSYADENACSFYGCQWNKHCGRYPTSSDCDRLCESKLRTCSKNSRCEAAYECLYSSHVKNNGICDSECHNKCEAYLDGDEPAKAAYLQASTCQLSCHQVCNLNNQPKIVTTQACTDSDSVIVRVSVNAPKTFLFQHACHFECSNSGGCTTYANLHLSSYSSTTGSFVYDVECPIPVELMFSNLEVSSKLWVEMTPVHFYPGPYCLSSNAVDVLIKETCDVGLECRSDTVPRVFGIDPTCGVVESGATHVNVSVGINPMYIDPLATCAFWIENSNGKLFCTWSGCYNTATVSSDGSTISCLLPPVLPQDVDIFVTVQVYDATNTAGKQNNFCFSHEGSSTFHTFDSAVFRANCPIPQCTKDNVPQIFGISPVCGVTASTIDVDVSIDPTYGSNARATCAFWAFNSASASWSCNSIGGCYSSAIVSADGSYITCTLPNGIPSDEEIRVTVQVWHANNVANKQRNYCFSHEGQSSFSWAAYDFGSFHVNCPPPPCSSDFVPRIYDVYPHTCDIAAGDDIVLAVGINPQYGDAAQARCLFWIDGDGDGIFSCTSGCYFPATVIDGGANITCSLPSTLPSTIDEVRATVQVFHSGNTAGRQKNQCFSHEGQSSSRWGENDYASIGLGCAVPECSAVTVPRVYRALQECGISSSQQYINLEVWTDPAYGEKAVATCAFWVQTGSSWSCTWHGCYANAIVQEGGDVISCELPSGLPSHSEVRVTVQVYDSDNVAGRQINQCFSHEGATPTQEFDYASFMVSCENVGCSKDTVPRVFSVEPACGVLAGETVDLVVGIDATYGSNARATCAFWVGGSCNWHGCYALGTVVDNVVTCSVPTNFPSNTEVFVTVQVYHVEATALQRQNNACFSHSGKSPASFNEFDYGVIQGSCLCAPGVPAKQNCPKNLCGSALCPRYPNAVCVENHCGVCAPYFYETALESYIGVNPLDCQLTDRCSKKCESSFENCLREPKCRMGLTAFLQAKKSSNGCDDACARSIIDTISNGNGKTRFSSFYLCYSECLIDMEFKPPVCSQPKAPGPCDAVVNSFYFNQKTQQCEEFTYGGCGGNDNRFATRQACEERCDIGACCLEKTVVSDHGFHFGCDEHGYDVYGYDANGVARDGVSMRPDSYANFSVADFGNSFSQDQRGNNNLGRDGAGFDSDGLSTSNLRDGLQLQYVDGGRYNHNGYDRLDLGKVGFDEWGLSYDGIFRHVQYSCSEKTRSECQALAEGNDRIAVLSYAQGKKCNAVQCVNPNWEVPRHCLYGGNAYRFGETFSYGCQTCECGTDGAVTCDCSSTVVRKELRDMTVDEVDQFVDAIKQMRDAGVWEEFANLHVQYVPQAYGNIAFLPWHRELLNRVELAMRDLTGNCALFIPYWDWTIDTLVPHISPVWNVVGGNGVEENDNCVNDGPFADFMPCIQRAWDLNATIPSFADIAVILAETDYVQMCARLEHTAHGFVSVFVGGTMTSSSAPFDPLFMLHFAQIDRLWNDWQVRLGRGFSYADGVSLSRPLAPFATPVGAVLDSEGQLCVRYAAPGENPPCEGVVFGGTNETESYYGDANLPEFNRDGFNTDFYDRNSRDRLGKNSNGDYVTVVGDTYFTSAMYGYNNRSFDSYGFNAAGMDERSCSAGFEGPLYMRDIFRVQDKIYDAVLTGAFSPPSRTCPPLEPLPQWWLSSFWLVQTGVYGDAIKSHMRDLEASAVGNTHTARGYTRSQHAYLHDLCFGSGLYDSTGDDHFACPPGVPMVSCFADPCAVSSCPANPTAVCQANYCGGCHAEYFNATSGARVDCHQTCGALTSSDCDTNPCATATCDMAANAVCEVSPCSGCRPRWYNATTGDIVSCERDDPCGGEMTNLMCGVDGVTYDSPCQARVEGVKIAYGGQCVSCDVRCSNGTFHKPACGADGETYDSVCQATCEGVKVLYLGECQSLPTNCDAVNKYRANEEARRSICHNTDTVCIPDLANLVDNRCFWNENSRKCSCQPTERVCTSSYMGCNTCCNIELRNCVQDITQSATACWEEYIACQDQCDSDFGIDVTVDAYVEFGISLNYNGSVVVDADQLRESIVIALGLEDVSVEDIMIVGIGDQNRRRTGSGGSVDVQVQISVNETQGNSTVDAVVDALQSGQMQSTLADEVGLSDDGDFSSFGDVKFAASSQTTAAPTTPQISTTGDGTTSKSKGLGTGAIVAIVVVALIVVAVIGAVLLRPRARTSVVRRLSKHEKYNLKPVQPREHSPVRRFSESEKPTSRRLSISQM
eukprot:m.109826 g.109826  ORF g.109826 m.109826 type:complete len:2809 (-) comp9210_c3_seq2:618-9044(-)